MFRLTDFVCWVAVVSLAAAFLLGLAYKWRWLEWLQVHAPNAFFEDLFRCKFCCSFWVSVLLALALSLVSGKWMLMFLPFCTTVITRELW